MNKSPIAEPESGNTSPTRRQQRSLPPEVLRRAIMNRLSRLETMLIQLERNAALQTPAALELQTRDMKTAVNELWVLLNAL